METYLAVEGGSKDEGDISPSRSLSGSSRRGRRVTAARKEPSPVRTPSTSKSRKRYMSIDHGGISGKLEDTMKNKGVSAPRRTSSGNFLQLTPEGLIRSMVEDIDDQGETGKAVRIIRESNNSGHSKSKREGKSKSKSEHKRAQGNYEGLKENVKGGTDIRRSKSLHAAQEERSSSTNRDFNTNDHSKKKEIPKQALGGEHGSRNSTTERPIREYRRHHSLSNESSGKARSSSRSSIPSRRSPSAGRRDPRRIDSLPQPPLSNSSSHSPSPKIRSNSRANYNKEEAQATKLQPFKSSAQIPRKKLSLKGSQHGNRRNATATTNKAGKMGTFRPYFVPVKKKRDLLGPTSHHIGSKTMIEDAKTENIPAKILIEGIKNISVAPFLHEGVPVLKVSHNKPGKCRSRILTLSDDQCTLYLTHSRLSKSARNITPKGPVWTPSKGWNGTYMRAIDVANICDFQVGAISSRWLEFSFFNYSPKEKKDQNSIETKSPLYSKRRSGSNRSMSSLALNPDFDYVASALTIFHINPTSLKMETVDFFVEDEDHRRAIVATLALMKYTYIEASQLIGNEILLLRYVLKDMMLRTNKNGPISMNEGEFSTLCRRLNFTSESISSKFQEYCKYQGDSKYDDSRRGRNKNKLDFHECLQLLQLLKGKENPSLEIWKGCFGQANCVKSAVVLEKFLHGPQREHRTCDLQDAHDLINIMNATELGEVLSNRKGSLLTKWQFEEFLRSEWNDIYDPAKRVIDRQRILNEPLSHYWINSSFNTSLMDDGDHSVESYARALIRGCKSIDLNCRDGTVLPNGEPIPIICPKNRPPESLSKDLPFRSVTMVVRKYLNENRNSYPIMLNLEIDCTEPFQKSIVRILKDVFGKHLFVPFSVDRNNQLPSPEDLRGMIVINAKRICVPSKDIAQKKQIELDDTERDKTSTSETLKVSSTKSAPSFLYDSTRSNEYVSELLSLTLFHDSDFSGYFSESMDLNCSHIHDFKDTKVSKIANKYPDNAGLWRRFNQSHLTRIYPSGKNANSTFATLKGIANYNPVLAWGMGCQMVAMNFQTHDNDLAINDGLFRQIGGVGYLPKPLWLLGLGERPKPTKVRIRIISGNCIPRAPATQYSNVEPCMGNCNDVSENRNIPIDNPCVILEVHDVVVRPDHGEYLRSFKHKVSSKNQNCFCPIFEDPGKKFPVETPDVAMIVFRVEQDKPEGKTLAQAAVPVNCLRKGYRSVQLYDGDNTRLGSLVAATLLVFVG